MEKFYKGLFPSLPKQNILLVYIKDMTTECQKKNVHLFI